MGKRYTQNDLDFIKSNIGKISFADMAKVLNRPYGAFREFCRKNKISSKIIINDYIIKGNYIYISLYNSNGLVIAQTKIDKEDYDKVKCYKWTLTSENYVMNKASGILLHRLIMNCPDDKVVDHINHDTLNNTKSNLRIVSRSENCRNTYTKNYYKHGDGYAIRFSDITFPKVKSKNLAIQICRYIKSILYPTSPEFLEQDTIFTETSLEVKRIVADTLKDKILFLQHGLERIRI